MFEIAYGRKRSFLPKRREFPSYILKAALIGIIIALLILFMPRITGSNNPPEIISLKYNASNLSPAGLMIKWTASASDLENDTITYMFLLNEKPQTNWSTGNLWEWKTTGLSAGNYSIEVRIRDGKHGGFDGYDASKVENYTIVAIIPANSTSQKMEPIIPIPAMIMPPIAMANEPPTLSGLNPDEPSPQFAGLNITWTADAEDPEKDTIQYKFSLKGPSTNGQLIEETDWITTNKWTWRPTSSDLGDSYIEVRIRDGEHAGVDSYDSSKTAEFTIIAPDIAVLAAIKTAPSINSMIYGNNTYSDISNLLIFFNPSLKKPLSSNTWTLSYEGTRGYGTRGYNRSWNDIFSGGKTDQNMIRLTGDIPNIQRVNNMLRNASSNMNYTLSNAIDLPLNRPELESASTAMKSETFFNKSTLKGSMNSSFSALSPKLEKLTPQKQDYGWKTFEQNAPSKALEANAIILKADVFGKMIGPSNPAG